jgi:hypothetical protein
VRCPASAPIPHNAAEPVEKTQLDGEATGAAAVSRTEGGNIRGNPAWLDHPAPPKDSRHRLLGAMARRRPGQEFVFTEEMPSTMANAKPSSPAKHLCGASIATYRARGASAIDDLARAAASKHPSHVVAASIQKESCPLLSEVPERQHTDRLSRRRLTATVFVMQPLHSLPRRYTVIAR